MRTRQTVTVLMSVYNGGTHLKTQIDSILCQTYREISLLIRDDGSEAETRRQLAVMQEMDSRITVIYGTHLGACLLYTSRCV